MSKKLTWITRTAIFIALLIAVQFITKPLGQFVTGSLVNFILLISMFTVGLASGITVAALSPLLAFLAGIGPTFVQLIPMVSIGNVALVVTAYYIAGRDTKPVRLATGIGAAAVAKFAALWLGIVEIMLPILPGIKEKQVEVLTATFTWPQLVTALIGGVLCLVTLPTLKKALSKSKI